MSLTAVVFIPLGLIGCLSCNEDLRAAILEHRFVLLLLTIAPVTLAGGFLAGWMATLVARAIERGTFAAGWHHPVWGAAVTGAGLGALFDGILLHQILQVHDMISNSLPPVTVVSKGVNLFWSGIFQLSVLVLIVLGIASHRHAQAWSPLPSRGFWGAFLFGWGLFNCYDVLTFHALFRYHDVVEVTSSPLVWNLGWLAAGSVIAVIGFMFMRSSSGPRMGRSSSVTNPQAGMDPAPGSTAARP